jgi:TRAP-type C4-dicarboxylate transport system permease small subunit
VSLGPSHPAGPPLAAPVRVLDVLVRALLVAALVAVLGFTVAQVLDRYLVKSAFNAHDQYARVGLVLLTFAGIAVGIRDRVNVRIELVSHLASAGVQRTVSWVLDAVVLVVAALLAVVGWRLIDIGASQPIMGTPLTYASMYAALLVGLWLTVVFLLLRFASRLCGGRLRVDAPPASPE